MLAQGLTERWKQPVVGENRGGASGIIGNEAAARADPDGYTLLMHGSGPHVVNISLFETSPYHPVNDCVPIGLGMTIPLLMVAPASDVRAVLAGRNAHQAKATRRSIGPGSPSELAGEWSKSMSGRSQLPDGPDEGGGPAIIETTGGGWNGMFDAALASGREVKT